MGYFGSVRFFKNLILLAVIIMIAVPTGLSIRFGSSLKQAEREIQELQELQEETKAGEDTSDEFQAESPYAQLYPDFYAPQKFSADVWESGVIYLTFDDGPSARTVEILDILKAKDAKATFFVIGNEDAEAKAILQRIVAEGHTLAMHSYTHDYNEIYASVEDYLADMYRVFTQIREATGVTPTLFRFPGGSINGYNGSIYQDLISEMMRRGFVPFDWHISSQDAASSELTPSDRIVSNIVSGASGSQRGVVLMHDSAPKTTTVAALAPTIDRLREMGFTLKALTPETLPVLYAYQD